MSWSHPVVLLRRLRLGAHRAGQSPREDVRVSMGEPTLVRDFSDGTKTLFYSKLPYGREIWAAVVDRNGVLLSFEQRLTEKWISRIQPEKSTAEDALDLLGPPFRRVKMPLKNAEAWEYQLDHAREADALRRALTRQRGARGVPALRPRHPVPISLNFSPKALRRSRA
jgi:hypothetical protein